MEQNPLATPQPRIDKVLSLIRKAMIINRTMKVSVEADCRDWEKWGCSVEFRVYPFKSGDTFPDTIYSKDLDTRDSNTGFDETFTEIKFILNHLLQKGCFPKEIPDFSEFTAMQKRIEKLQKLLTNDTK